MKEEPKLNRSLVSSPIVSELWDVWKTDHNKKIEEVGKLLCDLKGPAAPE